jgi:hypothetical protein
VCDVAATAMMDVLFLFKRIIIAKAADYAAVFKAAE